MKVCERSAKKMDNLSGNTAAELLGRAAPTRVGAVVRFNLLPRHTYDPQLCCFRSSLSPPFQWKRFLLLSVCFFLAALPSPQGLAPRLAAAQDPSSIEGESSPDPDDVAVIDTAEGEEPENDLAYGLQGFQQLLTDFWKSTGGTAFSNTTQPQRDDRRPASFILDSSNPMKLASDLLYNSAGSLIDSTMRTFNVTSFPFYSPPESMRSSEEYDYIIVGAGAAGCPLARTLSKRFKVLLIERGPMRSMEATPLAMNIEGAGRVIHDPTVSQLVITTQGVRTHVASVSGGGTAINMAIMIEEETEFFAHLKSAYGADWDSDIVSDAYEWISRRFATPMPEANLYGAQWRKGLEEVGFESYNQGKLKLVGSSGLSVDPSVKLRPGYRWGGYSLFNATNKFYRNAADIVLKAMNNDPVPETLTVLSGTTVQRVEFDTSGPVPRAVCVTYRATTPDDTAPIVSRTMKIFGVPLPDWTGVVEGLLNPIKSIQKLLNRHRARVGSEERRACINSDVHSEVILSAGVIPTTALLYKSGVGPKQQLEEITVPLVKEVPGLGQNIVDRVLIPIGAFFNQEAPAEGFLPRISPSIGARPFGPNCKGYKIGDSTLECTLATAEELSGAGIPEGVIYATRYIFPPEWRDDPLIDYMFEILNACSENRNPFNNALLAPLCALAKPVVACFRRVAANFYFTAEPKSRGTVWMRKDGSLKVNFNYMRHEQDLFDAVRGVSNIIKVVNGNGYRDVFQPMGAEACPVKILNGLLDLFLQLGSESRPFLTVEEANFEKIKSHLEELIPNNYRQQRRRLLENNTVVEEEAFNLQGSSAQPNPLREPTIAELTAEKRIHPRRICREDCRSPLHFDSFTHTCPSKDVFNFVYSGCDNNDVLGGQSVLEDELRNVTQAEDEILRGEGWLLQQASRPWKIQYSSGQWAATYPPILPDPNNPTDVAKYVLTYMTSIWHHASAAPMGEVVNSDFRVIGIDNFSIIDASVLNILPRMNPTASLLMMGRYAGLIKLRERGVNIEPELARNNRHDGS